MADKQTPQQKQAEQRAAAQDKTATEQAKTPAADRPVDQQAAEEQQRGIERDDLDGKTVEELQQLARDRDLAVSGTKQELQDRLRSQQGQQGRSGTGGDLGPAASSGDPDVHRLLAERQSAVSNNDQGAVEELDRLLAERGVEAG